MGMGYQFPACFNYEHELWFYGHVVLVRAYLQVKNKR